MEDDFDPELLRPVPYEPDTEVTMGWATLSGIVLCVVGLCVLCFWQGYSMGRRSLQLSPLANQQAGPKSAMLSATAAPKPSAGPQSATSRRSAMNSELNSNAVNPSAAARSAAGSASGPGLLVQVAAVSQQEDADALIGALRKRGYTVSVHRDPADGLIHVRVGPFADRNDANTVRQKLLNEGYNASVLP